MRWRTANLRRARRQERGAVLVRSVRHTPRQWYLMWTHMSAEEIIADMRAAFEVMECQTRLVGERAIDPL